MQKQTKTDQHLGLKKGRVGVSLGYPLYDEVVLAKSQEPVESLAAFVLQVFRFGFGIYRQVGSLKELKRRELALTSSPPPSTIPEETYYELNAALRLILERAPATVVEDLARTLTDRAGKYSDKPPKSKK